jgi:hypothetical protein
MRSLISFGATVIAAYWFDVIQYGGTHVKAADTLVQAIAAVAVKYVIQ